MFITINEKLKKHSFIFFSNNFHYFALTSLHFFFWFLQFSISMMLTYICFHKMTKWQKMLNIMKGKRRKNNFYGL